MCVIILGEDKVSVNVGLVGQYIGDITEVPMGSYVGGTVGDTR